MAHPQRTPSSSTAHQPLASGKLPGDLLARLISQYRTPADDAVIVDAGYGFDAAALTLGGETLIVKSDPITFATEGAARYLVAVNANDIACMGGTPRWMTVVMLLPEATTTSAMVEALFADLQSACADAKVAMIGGHTEITLGLDRPLLIGTMLGTTGPEGLLKPGSANAGDELYVTKWIGIEGSALLANERRGELTAAVGGEVVRSAAGLLDAPGISIVADARAMLGTGAITALHDPTEGGLATAVHEMAEASAVGAQLVADDVPMLPETRAICNHYGVDALGLLSSGALLIAARPHQQHVLQRAATEAGIPLARIGTLVNRSEGFTLITEHGAVPLRRFDSDEITRVL